MSGIYGSAGVVGSIKRAISDALAAFSTLMAGTAGAAAVGTPLGPVQTVIDSLGDTSNGIPGAIAAGASVLFVGDSIGEGVGSSYTRGWAYKTARSIMNKAGASGYGHHTTINMGNAMTEPGIASNGTLIVDGVVSSRLSLAVGQVLTVTGRDVACVDVFYSAAGSVGASIEFRLNGQLVATKALTGAGALGGVATTFYTALAGGALIAPSDVVELRAVGATAVVTGIKTLRLADSKPLAYVAARSGTSYGDYLSEGAMNELAGYLNFARTNNDKVLVIGLGTNSIYQVARGESPAAMITKLTAFVAGMRSRCTQLNVAVWVPPKASGAWPVVSGATYADFVRAIVAYGAQNDVAVLRNDRTIMGQGKRVPDGVHPDDIGQCVLTKTSCDIVGVTLDAGASVPVDTSVVRSVFAPMNGWAGFLGGPLTLEKRGNHVTLSAILAPGTQLGLGLLPVGWRPLGRDVYVTARTDAGPVALDIMRDGSINVKALPAQYLSVENVSFLIS